MIEELDNFNHYKKKNNEEITEVLDGRLFFELFKETLSLPTTGNLQFLSISSCLIDCLGLVTILEFFKENVRRDNLNDIIKSNNLMIEMFSIILNESNLLFSNVEVYDRNISFESENTFSKMLKKIRSNVHQFRFSEFTKKLTMIDNGMGRSRDIKNPHIDICLLFERIDKCKYMIGTNQFEYINKEMKTVDFLENMTFQLKSIVAVFFSQKDIYPLKKTTNKQNYMWVPYSYSDIIKSHKILGQREIDRLIIALDVTSSIYELFTYLIDVGENIKSAPYIVYFFRKLVSIHLDETIDNISGFISKSNNLEMNKIFSALISEINEEDINNIRTLRNNLHYQHQEKFVIGNTDESYNDLMHLLSINKSLMRKISVCLNCNPSRLKIIGYRFLRWVQS